MSSEQRTAQSDSQLASMEGIPDWLIVPIHAFIGYPDIAINLVELASRGISIIQKMPELVAILRKVANDLGRDDAASLTHAKELADLAGREVRGGFLMLHGQAVLTMWGGLEDHIRSILVAWLLNEPGAFQRKPFDKVLISFAEYESLSEEERAFVALEKLELKLGSPLKAGVDRFESLLSVFGLGGAVPKSISKLLFELAQVRNLFAHRRGIVDRRFASKCPWIQTPIGSTHSITILDLQRYASAVVAYKFVLLQRFRLHFGLERCPKIDANIDVFAIHCSREMFPASEKPSSVAL